MAKLTYKIIVFMAGEMVRQLREVSVMVSQRGDLEKEQSEIHF